MKRIKFKNLLLVGLTVLGLSACSNEIDNPIDNENGGINGYISLSITSPQTRTAPGKPSDVENGTSDESKINNVTIVLTDAAGNIKKAVSTSMVSEVTKPVEVPIGVFYAYALVNKPSEVKVAGNIQQLITAATAADATSGFKNGAFFMVNAKHKAAENSDENATGGVKVEIKSGNSASDPAKATVKVDRISAKIITKKDTPTVDIKETNLFTAVDMLGYHILNVNKQFNVIQKWSTANYRQDAEVITEALETPFHNEELNFDKQYFHSINEYTTVTKVNDEITSIVDNKKTITEFGNIYTTENRPEIMTYTKDGKLLPTSGKAETTGVIYQVQAKVAKDSNNDYITFYEYNGLVYTDIAEVEKAAGVDVGKFQSMSVDVLRAQDVRVYEKGIMYYTYYINDKQANANHKWNENNYNGVFRNSIYNLTVTQLTKLGDDVPGGGIDPDNPNPPIDTDEAYIEVSVTVNPWVLNTIDIKF